METAPSKLFKVLSIDGGGIKGLYAAEILRHLEEQFDCRIADYFDLLCGTSTGGLIALALAARIPAATVVDFYVEHGPKIFPSIGPIRRFFRIALGNSKFDSTALCEALRTMYGKTRVQDLHALVCIPSYSITDGRPYIFKYDHKEGQLTRDNKTLVSDIALATAAAPTFLPIVTLEDHDGKQFIDGGVYANNPTMIGTMEALRYFVGSGKEFGLAKILSISALVAPVGSRIPKGKRSVVWHLSQEVLPAFMEGQSHIVQYMMCQLHDLGAFPVDYLRIPSVTISADQAKDVHLDKITDSAIKLIKGKGNDQGLLSRKDARVGEFFAEKKLYTIQR